MRGKGYCTRRFEMQCRITPAYAGKRPPEPPKLTQQEDHPRLCGEKSSIHILEKKRSGSPPPMRGKGYLPDSEWCSKRITPAYAGKRRVHRRTAIRNRDHPRLCGEKGEEIELYAEILRITPAYAGKSRLVQRWNVFNQDHPRLCGEKANIGDDIGDDFRITPAYAGKSLF